jgi:hypothetical protein
MVAKIMILPRRSWDENLLDENWVKINWKSRFVFWFFKQKSGFGFLKSHPILSQFLLT